MAAFENVIEKVRTLILGESPQSLNLNFSTQPEPEQTRQPVPQVNTNFKEINNYEDLGVTGRLIFERTGDGEHQIGQKDGQTKFIGFQITIPKGEYTLEITDGELKGDGKTSYNKVLEKPISITDSSATIGGNFSDFGLEPFTNDASKSRTIYILGTFPIEGVPHKGALQIRCD